MLEVRVGRVRLVVGGRAALFVPVAHQSLWLVRVLVHFNLL